ncbi:MAG: 6-phosphogluconolactonase [Beijerinckiaceae bacterium]|nr:6-phosphogluconolactonase [Beijerinckiaceae bacterium]
MAEIRWHRFERAEELAAATARAAIEVVSSALAVRGEACLSLPGGSTPLPAFERLAAAALDWSRVTIIPGDDRLVADDDPLCNSSMLMHCFEPRGARVLRMNMASADPASAAEAIEARLADMPWPPDLVWLGIGADGHTASILPGPDMEAALDTALPRRIVGVRPDPLPPEAPVPRATMTRAALLEGTRLLVMLAGERKGAVLRQAIAAGDASAFPIGRVLAQARSPVDIYWSRT